VFADGAQEAAVRAEVVRVHNNDFVVCADGRQRLPEVWRVIEGERVARVLRVRDDFGQTDNFKRRAMGNKEITVDAKAETRSRIDRHRKCVECRAG
jgi:hypothetical protein